MFTDELTEELVAFMATGDGPVSHPWPERRNSVVPDEGCSCRICACVVSAASRAGLISGLHHG